ncbi:hypothetical protein [Streptomyces sp. NPDC002573]|uniref:hypothetical protein n=1 Tax=Streptomyces sp. NPDC002573 TaxID=3364651 RepID=UPI0036B01426
MSEPEDPSQAELPLPWEPPVLGREPCRVQLEEGFHIDVSQRLDGLPVRGRPLQHLRDPVEGGTADVHAVAELPVGHPGQLDPEVVRKATELDLPGDTAVCPLAPAVDAGAEDLALPFGWQVGEEPGKRVRGCLGGEGTQGVRGLQR